MALSGRTLVLEDDGGRCRATGDDEAGQAGWQLAGTRNAPVSLTERAVVRRSCFDSLV